MRLTNRLPGVLSAALLFLISSRCQADQYSNQHFKLTIPNSFQWSVSADSSGNTTYSFKDTKRPKYKTAEIAVTIVSYGDSLERFKNKSMHVVRDLYIFQEINDMKNGSLTFKAEPIVDIKISGCSAGMVNWKSEDYGVPNRGTLYLFIEDSTIYIINIQDYVERISSTMPVLMEIINSFTLVD